MELVRYIHLNPLRARLVNDLKVLDKFRYCGHSVLMGKRKFDWQETKFVLKLFDSKQSAARRRYREYVKKGILDGRRPELVGGGLLRSTGGWAAVKALRLGMERMKGDERILGDGDFVESVLKTAQEKLESTYELKAQGFGFEWLLYRVTQVMELAPRDILSGGKYPQRVRARSLLCYWGSRELGMTTIALAKKINLAQPTVSQAVLRGQKIAEEIGLNFRDLLNQ